MAEAKHTTSLSAPPVAAERPMRSDARRNRELILGAARELFATQRSDVQVDDIARLAGVGVGTVYRHFPYKEALMGELVRERFIDFNERLQLAIDGDEHPFEALAASMRDNAASVAEDAATRYAFMSGGERVFEYASSEAARFLELSRTLVERAQADGTLRADFAAEHIPMLMCAVCATIDVNKPGWDWRTMLDMLVAGMRAAPVTSPPAPRRSVKAIRPPDRRR